MQKGRIPKNRSTTMNIIFHFKGTWEAGKDRSFTVEFILVVSGKMNGKVSNATSEKAHRNGLKSMSNNWPQTYISKVKLLLILLPRLLGSRAHKARYTA